jgi:hypothetical protein
MGSLLAAAPRVFQKEPLLAGFMIASAAKTTAGGIAAFIVLVEKGG